jgi:protein-S-isoprenylcysteine O-methyltransferase Ste14
LASNHPLAFHNWLATALVFGPVVALSVVEYRRFRGDLARRAGDPTFFWLQATQAAGLGLGALAAEKLPGAALPGSGWLWAAIGCVVGIDGVVFRQWAIVTLGAQFTRNIQVTEGSRVVDRGPYRRLRHPSYTGAIVMYAGIGIGLANAVSLVACVLLPAVGYVLRIPREEALLRDQLGEPYAEYARRTRRLVPGLW